MMDDEHNKKIRSIQIKKMAKDNKPYSFSQAVNDVLSRALE